MRSTRNERPPFLFPLSTGTFCALLVCISPPLIAAIANGGFETGDLSGGWVVEGSAAVEVLEAANFSVPIVPPEGDYLALISTGPGDIDGWTGNLDGNAYTDHDITRLSIDFCVRSAPADIAFDWAFVTSEAFESGNYDDYFLVTLEGVDGSEELLGRSVFKGVSGGGVSPLPDTPSYDRIDYVVTSPGGTNGSTYNRSSGRTEFQQFTHRIDTTGTFTLRFNLADQTDSVFDSGFLLDDVQLPAACNLMQITSSGITSLELKDGSFVLATEQNTEGWMAQETEVSAFVSNANLTGDNPNLQTQIFVHGSGGFQRITAMVDGDAQHPALSSDARWLTFAANGDLTPSNPGNSDNNFEIFRVDLNTGVTEQITDTSGCTNSDPSVADHGSRWNIGFSTDCSNLVNGFNADGNQEVVVWDQDGPLYIFQESTGCSNKRPVLSRSGGRFLSFLSNCDPVGDNPDGNDEIVQWRLRNNNSIRVRQVTQTNATLVDAPSSSHDGRYLTFVSTANLTGDNAQNALVPYRYDRNGGGSFTQVADASPLKLYTIALTEDQGRYVGLERLDLLTGGTDLLYVDTTTSTTYPVFSGIPAAAAFGGVLRGIGIDTTNTPRLLFQSNGDFIGENADLNIELWKGSSGQ